MKICKCGKAFEPPVKKTRGVHSYSCPDCVRAYNREYMRKYKQYKCTYNEKVVFVDTPPDHKYLLSRIWAIPEVRYSAGEGWLNGARLRGMQTGREYRVIDSRLVAA